MTPRDRRQYTQMLGVVATVRAGGCSLVRAADSLLFLLSALETVDEGFATQLTGHIGTIESAGVDASGNVLGPGQSVERDRSTRPAGSGYPDFVDGALDEIQALVASILSSDPDADLEP